MSSNPVTIVLFFIAGNLFLCSSTTWSSNWSCCSSIVIVNLYSASSGEAPQRRSRPNKTKPWSKRMVFRRLRKRGRDRARSSEFFTSNRFTICFLAGFWSALSIAGFLSSGTSSQKKTRLTGSSVRFYKWFIINHNGFNSRFCNLLSVSW